MDLGTCTGFDCTGNTVARDSPGFCDDVACTANECCEPKALCNTLTCSGTKGHKDGADSIYCAGADCAMSDEDDCCEDKGTCDVFGDGDGIMYCDSFLDCDTELIDQAIMKACAEAVCTAAECCTTATGDPLPEERPATVDADREVAQFGFVCEGISLHAMTDQMQDTFKDKMCEVFLAETATADVTCSCALAAGSVKATVTITAPAGENLGDARTPKPETVVAAVKEVPDIMTAATGNKPIGVAAVSGVLFKAGATEATAVHTRTTTTTTTTTPGSGDGDDDEDLENDSEDTDASYRSTVFAALAVVFSVALAN